VVPPECSAKASHSRLHGNDIAPTYKGQGKLHELPQLLMDHNFSLVSFYNYVTEPTVGCFRRMRFSSRPEPRGDCRLPSPAHASRVFLPTSVAWSDQSAVAIHKLVSKSEGRVVDGGRHPEVIAERSLTNRGVDPKHVAYDDGPTMTHG